MTSNGETCLFYLTYNSSCLSILGSRVSALGSSFLAQVSFSALASCIFALGSQLLVLRLNLRGFKNLKGFTLSPLGSCLLLLGSMTLPTYFPSALA
jgi:hypothetical protein